MPQWQDEWHNTLFSIVGEDASWDLEKCDPKRTRTKEEALFIRILVPVFAAKSLG
jgi:hypothetical protein